MKRLVDLTLKDDRRDALPPAEILIIDDENELRQLLSELLTDRGFVVHTFANGLDGLRYLQDSAVPSLIILDVMMHPVDGIEFLARRPAHVTSVPVIVWTASRRHWKSPPAGAQRLFTKPLDLQELLATIDELTGQIPA